MWNENKVRIIDIAQELGVSTATVSNVIHGKTKKISDKTVEMVQRKLQERGIRIPGDISVAGFDGTPICSQIVPTLTSVYQDNRERAYMAVDLLQKMREELEYTGDFVLPVKLVLGGSTARCR